MKFNDFLNEGILNDISNEPKVFVLVIGGSASGKNYWYDKHLDFPLVDIDKITKRLSSGDFENARKYVSKAIAIANKEMTQYFQNNLSVAQVTTGSGIKAVQNKFKKAREYGFKTALVLVDTDVKTAIARNKKRADSGKQGLIPDWKVEKTNAAAKETFNVVSRDVDFSIKVKT